jgi:hypothetical protein
MTLNNLQVLNLSYTRWKSMRTFLAGTTYYTQSNEFYDLILVDLTRGFISKIELDRTDPTDQTNVLDFETTIKTTATLVLSNDEAIAKVIGA